MDLVGLISDAAASHSHRPAVSHNGVITSYTDLMYQKGAISRQLQERCSQLGKRVGVCIERSTPLVASLLAVHEAEHTFVPMDP